MNLGDPCSIWDGEGNINHPSSWLFGFVKAIRNESPKWAAKYQVFWNRFPNDDTWYMKSDIDMKNAEGMLEELEDEKG